MELKVRKLCITKGFTLGVKWLRILGPFLCSLVSFIQRKDNEDWKFRDAMHAQSFNPCLRPAFAALLGHLALFRSVPPSLFVLSFFGR